MQPRVHLLVSAATVYLLAGSALSDHPKALVVIAHPDDDAAFSSVLYQLTHQLDRTVDLALVTDGSGGYRYSTLAEEIYGVEFTNEEVARQHLPAIRKQELMAGGAIVGISKYFFFDQLDDAFTTDVDPVLADTWDAGWVRQRLMGILWDGDYDLIIIAVPAALGGVFRSLTAKLNPEVYQPEGGNALFVFALPE